MSFAELKIKKRSFDYWLSKNSYYHVFNATFYKFVVPKNSKVLHIGCRNGFLLNALSVKLGVGIEFDEQFLLEAREKHPDFNFFSDLTSLENSELNQKFDYIIISNVIMETDDIQIFLQDIKKFCDSHTRLVLDWYSTLWEPILNITQKLGLRRPTDIKNWVSVYDVSNFLYLSGFDIVTSGKQILFPKYIPVISWMLNNFFALIPGIRSLCLENWVIARPILNLNQESYSKNYSVSIIIPCRNEMGNIEAAVKRCPTLGKFTEIIFIEGHSKDNTYEEIERVANLYPEKNIKYSRQDGIGKGDAVRKGFAMTSCDILMIQDADLTAPPEELPKFFDAIASGKGEFINGSRLVYGMENNAMRFLNLIANYGFAVLFSWTLGQRVKDTLCGTKVLFKKDYDLIASNRDFFGDFDPFGDFDLLFGAAKLSRKIVDMPVKYKSRTYGTSQISRFSAGVLLLRMNILAIKKFKLK